MRERCLLYPPKADIRGCGWHVRFVPIADISHISALMKTERPLHSGLSENSITLTSLSSAPLLMLHQDLGPERHARVKIGDIVVDQPEAA
jgi:hypothetical protein